MKLYPLLPSLRFLAATVILTSFAPEVGCAQTKADAGGALPATSKQQELPRPVQVEKSGGTRPAADAAASTARLDFEIGLGGKSTAQEMVNEIVTKFRAAGEPVNVLVTGGGGAVSVPPIRLQRVSFEQAVMAVALAANPPLSLEGAGHMFVLHLNATPAKMRVFNVSLFLRLSETARGDEKERDLEMNRLKERHRRLYDSIQKGVSFAQHADLALEAPRIEIAPIEELLFASGSPEALEIVAEVVRALGDPHNSPATPARP